MDIARAMGQSFMSYENIPYDLRTDIFNEMIQYNLVRNEYKTDIFKIKGHERPPMLEIPEYRQKFNIQ